ncbi:MAG: hypothetical protein SGILL_008534, partial [Bacillariaceae sp.]
NGVGAFQSRRAVANEASRLTKKFSRRILNAWSHLPLTIRRGVWMTVVGVGMTVAIMFQVGFLSRNPNVVVIHSKQQNQRWKPQVCSHQLLNPPPALKSNSILPNDGSLLALKALWTAGIECFDIDVVTLQDGTLLAAHPRRLAKTLKKNADSSNNVISEEAKVHDNTLAQIQQVPMGKSPKDVGGAENFPFPVLDADLLPLYATLVKGSHPFFKKPTMKRLRQAKRKSSSHPRRLQGPLLNLDLKQGPYLTKEKLLSIVDTIHKLQLEDNVAICATPLDDSDSTSLDMLNILHQYNLQISESPVKKTIPLGLVLRDLVQQDQDVSQIRQRVQHQYADSIRLLVPSFKFPSSWYREVYRDESSDGGIDHGHAKAPIAKAILPQLPMTAWTIDSQQDFEYASQMDVAAVVANRPMEFV